jgi:hypothetical protein
MGLYHSQSKDLNFVVVAQHDICIRTGTEIVKKNVIYSKVGKTLPDHISSESLEGGISKKLHGATSVYDQEP